MAEDSIIPPVIIEVGDMVRIRKDQINQHCWGNGIVIAVEERFYNPPNGLLGKTPRIKVYWFDKKLSSFEPHGGLEIISKIP